MKIRVTCAIIESEDKILLAQRSEEMSLPLKWEFPGGKVEDDESEVECLKREIMEELGVPVQVIDRMDESEYKYGEKTIVLIPFICHIRDGEPQNYEHADIRWCSISEAKDMDFAEADIAILNHYEEKKLLGN